MVGANTILKNASRASHQGTGPGEVFGSRSLADSEIGSETETISFGSEHGSLFLADDHYEDYWRIIYGGDWDSPIYFDNIRKYKLKNFA